MHKKFKKALETASSKTTLKVQINMLKEPAYDHPLVRAAIDEVEKNAAHYTAYKSRKGIKKTTSIVDNFLKIVKRKLRQAESFRDRTWAGVLLRGLANVRNFVPFMPGAKNANKSPFMLAQGETYGLPWMQVMNMRFRHGRGPVASLGHAAVDEQVEAGGLEQMTGAGDGMFRAEVGEVHGVICFRIDATTRSAVPPSQNSGGVPLAAPPFNAASTRDASASGVHN